MPTRKARVTRVPEKLCAATAVSLAVRRPTLESVPYPSNNNNNNIGAGETANIGLPPICYNSEKKRIVRYLLHFPIASQRWHIHFNMARADILSRSMGAKNQRLISIGCQYREKFFGGHLLTPTYCVKTYFTTTRTSTSLIQVGHHENVHDTWQTVIVTTMGSDT